MPLITSASNTAVTGKTLNTAVTNFFKGNIAVTFEKLGLQIRCILNEDGSISMNAEDTARGFGWYRVETKNGKEYMSVLWARMNGFLKDFGFAHECAKDDYIRKTKFY